MAQTTNQPINHPTDRPTKQPTHDTTHHGAPLEQPQVQQHMPGGVSARVARALRRVDSCRQPEPQRRRRLRGDKAHLATVDRVPGSH
eukprot:186966-Chlamydomonas_euryale.AAC.1